MMATTAAPNAAFFAHPSPRFDATVVAPIPSHDRAPLLKHHPGAAWVGGPFHPHRPPTPTVRLLPLDTNTASETHTAQSSAHRRSCLPRSNMHKSIGQLLGQEWMIEEDEEEAAADQYTIHDDDRIDEEDEEDEEEVTSEAGRAELEILRSLAQRSTPTHRWTSMAGKSTAGAETGSLFASLTGLPWPGTDEKVGFHHQQQYPHGIHPAPITSPSYAARWAWASRRHNSVGDVSMLHGARELREGMSR